MGLLDFFKKKPQPRPVLPLAAATREPPESATDDLDDEDASYEEELLESRIEGISSDDVVEEAIVRGEVELAGGQGESVEDAVIIEAPDTVLGAAAEKVFLERKFGPRLRKPARSGGPGAAAKGWTLKKRSQLRKGNKHYEKLDITLADGAAKAVWFDTTGYHGKEPELA